MALIGLGLVLGLHLILILWFVPRGISLPLALPVLCMFALLGFISTYAAYPIIDRYMIAPYEDKEDEEDTESLLETSETDND